MKYSIRHEVPGRIRLDLLGKIPDRDCVALEEIFLSKNYVTRVSAYPKAGSIAIRYDFASNAEAKDVKRKLLDDLENLEIGDIKSWEPLDGLAPAPRYRHLFREITNGLIFNWGLKMLMPLPVRTLMTLRAAIPYWTAALRSLRAKNLSVEVLDGTAIAFGFVQGKPSSSGNAIALLKLGEILEDFTQKRSASSLVRSLLDIPTNATLATGDVERQVDVSNLKAGDVIVVRMGSQIPADGEVTSGSAMINQSSLTGETAAVKRSISDSVYAGTSVEEGEIYITVTTDPLNSKINKIIEMVEQSENDKSNDQRFVEEMANRLVPWNFALAALVALTTKSLAKTSSALMVDYSCALRLSGSIAVMAAQSESAKLGFMVKGSKYFERIANADTLVFDKTGTLTQACPKVKRVECFNDVSELEVVRLAACLEEHFPHPVARAVVNYASEKKIEHKERHAKVEYIVAHGIASSIDGKRCVIGSEHFVIEDEKINISEHLRGEIKEKSTGLSSLYLAVEDKLWGVIYIEDPLRSNVKSVVSELKALGFSSAVMLTGDNERAAKRIADEIEIDDYRYDMLPEDKRQFILDLQAQGHSVCMIGDGINDSPALAAADVSVAMSAGSAVAREAADISLISDDLSSLVNLRRLSSILMKHMRYGYKTTILVNSLLLALGISGKIQPTTSSLLHNTTTVAISSYNARKLLP